VNDFEQWLTTEFATAAQPAPLQAPSPSQARYKQKNWFTLSVLPALRPWGRGLAFAAAVLLGISAMTTHSLNPGIVARQAAASIGACTRDLSHAQFGSCLGEFTTPQFDKKPNKVTLPPPDNRTTPLPYVNRTPEASPTSYPTPTSTPTPPPMQQHATPTPPPHPTNPPPTGSGLFSDNFQGYAPGSTPSYTGGQGTVVQEGSNNYLQLTENRVSISQPGWAVNSVNAQIREHGSIEAAVGQTDGTTNYFCGITGGNLELDQQTPSGYTNLGTSPYSGDINTTWATVGLKIVNGQATCSVLSGASSVQASVLPGFQANAVLLMSRVSSLSQTDDFDNIYIGG
jgi:hypothetical protein